jgi:LacI family transcriptional regulator
MLVKHGVPVVLVDSADGRSWCSVSVDDVEGGDLAVTHLMEQGHERIAFVGGPLTTVQVADRHRGAVRAVERMGQDPRAVLTVLGTTALDVGEGRRGGERLAGLPLRRRPTAAFCANDLLALGMLQEMTGQGLAVPDDLAIVGYDDIEFASAAAVPLTSVRQPRHELGRMAAQLLLREAAEGVGGPGATDHVHRQVEFTPELVVRSSSRAVPPGVPPPRTALPQARAAGSSGPAPRDRPPLRTSADGSIASSDQG